ncbi:MAG: hypothetical protein IKE29_22110 [Paenibacillus sp.]|uniref:STM3941 family protein n=1 Tax=Paenibacillus sp. TaxID=58172 RepID=UPI00260031D3|nr:STM3941 family protein [Paenibacillus sp.]MBR2567288.1 hypothetical protein [Paenibacillus sp.]
MNTSYEQHVEYPSRGRMAWFAAGSALFVGAGLFLMFDPSEDAGSSMISRVIGLLSILFFGLCFVYYLVKMIKKEPSFVINERGFIDSSSYTSGGDISWEDVEHIFMYELMGQQMIGVKLKDEQAFLERQSGVKRKLMTASTNMVDATISIPQNSITLPLDQLYLMMINQWQRVQDTIPR